MVVNVSSLSVPLVKSPQVMGVLNLTPDSFYDGGQYQDVDAVLFRIEAMIEEGADWIDIGAVSSRPGSQSISLEEEMKRLTPIVTRFRSRFDVPFSLDTYQSEVLDWALGYGVGMLNCIRPVHQNPDLVSILAQSGLPVVLMHMLGTPERMQDCPEYEHVTQTLYDYFETGLRELKQAGVHEVILDPGIGFGKRLDHNMTILRDLHRFLDLGAPMMVGLSRKSFIGDISGARVSDRLPGSLVSAIYAYQKGAHFFRVHDVAETKQALLVAQALCGEPSC
ncbi:MAG: dihydropteroate synthase [Actinobacteria bacterium]|nr:dihydropteroate synthase [Actinomycetota bacterium]